MRKLNFSDIIRGVILCIIIFYTTISYTQSNRVDKILENIQDVLINSEFKEIIWLYPSTNSTECDSYVIYSPNEGYWTYGSSIFTTFADKTVFGNTITTGVTVAGNNLYNIGSILNNDMFVKKSLNIFKKEFLLMY